MKKATSLVLAVVIVLLFSSCGVDYSKTYYYNEKIAFTGTQISLVGYLLGKNAPDAYDEMYEFLRELDGEISLTRTDTPLYAFNETKTLDQKIKISRHTYNMLSCAIELHDETAGAFNIAVYNLSRLWRIAPGTDNGYSSEDDIPSTFTLPSIDDVRQTKLTSDIRIMNLYEENGEYFVSKSLSNPNLPSEITAEVATEFRVDLGALAKGYAADICLQIAQNHQIESGIINISGNLILIGQNFSNNEFTPWQLFVDNPRPRPKFMRTSLCVTLISQTVSVVTSGDYQRFYKHNSGVVINHIINPFTGIPTGLEHIEGTSNAYRMLPQSFSSVTIITAESARADALSTAIFVMGVDEGVEFVKQKSDIKAIMFSENYSANGESNAQMLLSNSIELFETETYDLYKSYSLIRI